MNRQEIQRLAERLMSGGSTTEAEAVELTRLAGPEIHDLMAWAHVLRRHFRGDSVHLCSIVNAKSGRCSENCAFCSQSIRFTTGIDEYPLVETDDATAAAESAAANGAQALGLVAAWKGLHEGRMLDEVCDRIRAVSAGGAVRADASLGLIQDEGVARRLREAGLSCYNHNLETARSFYPTICDTHAYDDRIQTVRHCKAVGLRVCCGGIFGMGETWDHRVELALQLRELDVDVMPINFLNPIPGTPLGDRHPLPPLEALHIIAFMRFMLPAKEIMVAGGREVALKSLQPMMFLAGASATMVGNYLTTPGQDPRTDLEMIESLGLRWDEHRPELVPPSPVEVGV